MNPLLVYFLTNSEVWILKLCLFQLGLKIQNYRIINIYKALILCHCIFLSSKLNNVMWWVPLVTPFYRWGTWGVIRLSGFPKVSQLVSSKARIWASIGVTSKFHVCLPMCCFTAFRCYIWWWFSFKVPETPYAVKSAQF